MGVDHDVLTAERPVTSLALQGSEACVNDALESLVRVFPRRWEQLMRRPAEQAGDYLVAADLAGRVVVEGPEGSLIGRIAALDARSGLRLQIQGGGEQVLPLEHLRSVSRG